MTIRIPRLRRPPTTRWHQLVDDVAKDPSMLPPLIWMAVAVKLMFIAVVAQRASLDLLDQDRRKRWVAELIGEQPS